MAALLSLEEARALLLEGVPRTGTDQLPTGECLGRILAADVTAVRDQPPDPVSAMDGYAVRSADVAAGASLRVIGQAPAGAPFAGTVGRGEAVRIATGGVVPAGADRIVIQENVERSGDYAVLTGLPGPATHIRAAGCDFAAGTIVARAGELLTPARLALAAAANAGVLNVARRPRVAVFPSGDELREPGEALGRGQIVNSGSYAIAGLAEGWGADASRQAILPDDADACEARLRNCSDSEVIVTLGGASVGDRDALRPVIDRLGARILFEKIAVMPGKPSWHARFPDGRLVLGLPGNPASAFVCAHLLLAPLLFALTGRDPADATRLLAARTTAALPAAGPRETYLRAHVSVGDDGVLTATPAHSQDSSLLTPLARGNALLRREPGAPAAAPGDPVQVLLHGAIDPA